MIPWNELERKALEARDRAYAPYSHYHVGAAVLSESGRVYTGVNVENASYGATVCAERVAIFSMIAAEGPQARLRALVVATRSDPPAAPCGLCLQVISEFGDSSLPIVSISTTGSRWEETLENLMPHRFSPEHLDTSE